MGRDAVVRAAGLIVNEHLSVLIFDVKVARVSNSIFL